MSAELFTLRSHIRSEAAGGLSLPFWTSAFHTIPYTFLFTCFEMRY